MMKKVIALVLSLAMALSLVACGGTEAPKEDVAILYTNDVHTYIDGTMSNTTALRVTAGKETIIFLMDPARLQEILKESSSDVYVLNLSQENVELPGAEIVNEFGESLTNGMIPPGCSGYRA